VLGRDGQPQFGVDRVIGMSGEEDQGCLASWACVGLCTTLPHNASELWAGARISFVFLSGRDLVGNGTRVSSIRLRAIW
jgi:hypothetical protein